MAPTTPPAEKGDDSTGWGSSGVSSTGRGIARVALEPVNRQGDLQVRPHRDGGARLGHHEWKELRRLGAQGGGGVAQEGAAVFPRPGGPRRLGIPGGGRGSPGIAHPGVGRQPDDLLGGRVDHLIGSLGRIDPFPPDEQPAFVVPGDLGHADPLVRAAHRAVPPFKRVDSRTALVRNYYFRHFAESKTYDSL